MLLCKCDSDGVVCCDRALTPWLQGQLQTIAGASNQSEEAPHQRDDADSAKLQQQLSMAVNEIAHLRAEASSSSATIQLHLNTIQELEKQRVVTSSVSPSAPSSLATNAAPSALSLAHGEIGKMLEKKQVRAVAGFDARPLKPIYFPPVRANFWLKKTRSSAPRTKPSFSPTASSASQTVR